MIIVAHHRINPLDRGTLSVTKDNFRRQLLFLLDKGYRNISLTEIACGSASNRPRDAFAITFDDGYQDNYLHAFPILQELHLTATVFVTVGYIGTQKLYPWVASGVQDWGGATAEDLPLTWTQIREMQASGVFDVGSHTMAHTELPTVEPSIAWTEITDSKRILEDALGRPVQSFCYPRGNLTRDVVAMVAAAGYSLGVVTPPRLIRRSRLTLPRVGVYGHTDLREFALKTNRAIRPVFETGLWAEMTRARKRVAGGRHK